MDASLALLEAQSQAGDEVRRALEMARLRADLQPPQDRKARLREACEGFEAIFIQKIWEQMRKNVPQDGYLHSRDEAMYQAMYDQEFARKMASAGGIGLADMLYDQLAHRLGDSSRTASTRNSPRSPIVPAASSPVGKNIPAPNLHGEDQKP